MKNYIFVTHKGHTYQPGSASIEPDIENLQVIGFAKGNSPDEATKNLLKEDTYLKETSFNGVIALESKSSNRTFHYLKDRQM